VTGKGGGVFEKTKALTPTDKEVMFND